MLLSKRRAEIEPIQINITPICFPLPLGEYIGVIRFKNKPTFKIMNSNVNSQPSVGLRVYLPVMLSFFVMGFVDLVGIATNYVKESFDLTDTAANIFPSLVFFWFLIFSVPTGMLMNRIGRKKTVLISLVVTFAALFIPIVSHEYISYIISFSLLGIGNTLMQVSLNPLISSLISNDKMASTLTLGQFVKAIASFIAPILAAWGALNVDLWGLGWEVLFLIFSVVSVVAVLALWATPIHEEPMIGKTSSFTQCFALLGDKFILMSFVGIMCHVGIDVGVNVTAPKLLMERVGMSLSDAGFATSIYFLFRTIGCFSGSMILAKISSFKFFMISVLAMIVGIAALFFVQDKMMIYICIALLGFGNSNIFPIIFAKAMQHLPEKRNEVSGLLIMGLFGGTLFPFAMGLMSDALMSQIGAVAVISVGVIYLAIFNFKIKGTSK